jgi:hypothetical protein
VAEFGSGPSRHLLSQSFLPLLSLPNPQCLWPGGFQGCGSQYWISVLLGGWVLGGSSGQEVGFASALQCTQHPACRAPAPGTSGFLTLSTGQFRNKRPGEVQGAGSCPQPLHAVWPKNQTKTKNSIAIVSECALKEEVCVSSLRRGIICQQKAGCYSINPGNQVTQLYANVCTCREGVGQSLRKPRAALGRPGSQPGHQRITDPGSSNPGKPGRGQKGKGGGGRAAQC